MEKKEYLAELKEAELVTAPFAEESRGLRIYRQKNRYYLRTKELQELTKEEFEEVGSLFYEAAVTTWQERYVNTATAEGFTWKLRIRLADREVVSQGKNAAPEEFNKLLSALTQWIHERSEERYRPFYKA